MSSVPYSSSSEAGSLANRRMHLTNYAVQKTSTHAHDQVANAKTQNQNQQQQQQRQQPAADDRGFCSSSSRSNFSIPSANVGAAGAGVSAESAVPVPVKWSLRAANGQLAAQGVDVPELWRRVEALLLKAFVCGEDLVGACPNAFELFGVDVIVDEDARCPCLLACFLSVLFCSVLCCA